MVVVSSDLRNHPVGRFWLPIARQLHHRFRVILSMVRLEKMTLFVLSSYNLRRMVASRDLANQ